MSFISCRKRTVVVLNEPSGNEALGWIEQGLMGPFSHLALTLSPVLPQLFLFLRQEEREKVQHF